MCETKGQICCGLSALCRTIMRQNPLWYKSDVDVQCRHSLPGVPLREERRERPHPQLPRDVAQRMPAAQGGQRYPGVERDRAGRGRLHFLRLCCNGHMLLYCNLQYNNIWPHLGRIYRINLDILNLLIGGPIQTALLRGELRLGHSKSPGMMTVSLTYASHLIPLNFFQCALWSY